MGETRPEKNRGPRPSGGRGGERGITQDAMGVLDNNPDTNTFLMKKGNRVGMLGVLVPFLSEASDTGETSAFRDSINIYKTNTAQEPAAKCLHHLY